jgi:hypothetical protein
MTKYIFSILLLFAVVLHTSAQKEIYFSSTPKDSIKVQSMHGVEIESSINTTNLFSYYDPNNKSFSVPLGIGYFNEKRISQTMTLITRITLTQNFINAGHYVSVKDSMQIYDSLYHFTTQKLDHYKFEYQLTLGISVEPRWYFSFKNRYQNGKAKLNSGWFVSTPLSFSTILINTYKPEVVTDSYLSYKTYCYIGLSGVLGYRRAISKQWFLEAQGTLVSLRTGLFGVNKQLYISDPYPNLLPSISLKAAYTFNK